jgi:autotransporter-associated beta strand protein
LHGRALIDFSNTTGPNGDNKVSAGSIAGAGSYNLGANELTTGSNNLSTEVSGVIADGGNNGGTGGSLVKIGTGTLTLSGANTYTGGTTINGGTLQLGSAGGIGSILRTVTVGSGATFEAVNADTSGITTISNGGNTYFRNGTSAGSATIVNNGNLGFYNTGTAGSARITNNHQLTFDANATAGSALVMNVGHTLFEGNATPGSAQLFNASVGSVFDLSMTSGPNGDNKLTAGSLLGVGTFYLGANELTVGSNNLSTNVTGVIADGGSGGGTGASLVKVGTGTMTLSGVNTYTGATTIDGGTLAVNGSILSSSGVTVNSGAILGGNGIVGNTTIANGGALAPGNSIGTLTVSGNLAFTAGSFYTVEVSPTSADRTNVTGTATLTGATVQAVALVPARFRAQTYTILNASGGLGGTQFAGLDVTNSFRACARNPHLTYDANNVYLVLDPGEIILPSGTNANQANVAGGINRAVFGGATPPVAFDVLLNLDGTPLKNALTQISGETATGAQQSTFNAMTMFMGVMTDPFIDGRGDMSASAQGVSAYAADGAARRAAVARDAFAAIPPAVPTSFEQRWSVWAAGFGGSQTSSGNTALGSNGATSRLFGSRRGRLLVLSTYVSWLCAGRRRYQFFRRQWRQRPIRPVPGRRVRAPPQWPRLPFRRASLWLAGRHHRSHGDGRGHRQAAGALQRQHVCGPRRGRLPVRHAVDGDYALRRRAGHLVRAAGLC